MADWARDTPWRQGHVLSKAAIETLKFQNVEASDDLVCVVVSHDCDLANGVQQEPNLEVIVGHWVAKADGNYTSSKNARRLHLEFQRGETAVIAELDASKKTPVSKSELASFSPDDNFILSAHGRNILERWLAARYRRSAFPDEFGRRLSDSGLISRITKIMGRHGAFVRAIFFDLDEGQQVERRSPDDLYALDIYLVYSTDDDPDRAQNEAATAAAEIKDAFASKLNKKDGWELIELRDCMPISDEAITVKHAAQLKEWRLEHLSLRENPPQAMAE